MPDLGEGLQAAEIVEWHVKAGDEIAADQPLVSVETAKAIVDIPSPYDGRVAKLYGEAGQLVHVRAPLAGKDAEVFVYEGANHGFNCWDRGSYHPASAALAHGRALAFLASRLF